MNISCSFEMGENINIYVKRLRKWLGFQVVKDHMDRFGKIDYR